MRPQTALLALVLGAAPAAAQISDGVPPARLAAREWYRAARFGRFIHWDVYSHGRRLDRHLAIAAPPIVRVWKQMRISMKGLLGTALLALAAPAAAQQPAGKVQHLAATPATVAYGYYWAGAKPVLTVASGDIVEVETLITSRPDRLEAAGVPPGEVEQPLRNIVDSVTDRGPGGHILTGPIFVRGAEPGDVLEVRILAIDLAIPYGYNGCSGFLKENCQQPTTKIIQLDRAKMTADFGSGITIPLHPFFGSMGVAPPPDSGRVSSNPPGMHAGNLDNRELVAGTTLFIPVHAPGALFEIGDGHAAQGDGEVDQTAIETSLRGRVQLVVRKDMHLTWPQAETPTHFITMGADPDLTAATRIAVQNAVDFIADYKAWPKMEAYRLVSIACDVRVTELVDGNVGVHVMIPKAILGPKETGSGRD